jgi:uncharacterized protein with PIN domain
MIVVDASAFVAIVFDEPERDAFVRVLEETDKALITTARACRRAMPPVLRTPAKVNLSKVNLFRSS